MGLFSKKTIEARALDEQILNEDAMSSAFLAALKNPTQLTEQDVTNIPAVAGCIEFVSSMIACQPVKMYEENEDGVTEIKDDPRLTVLNDDTGDLLSGPDWKKAIVRDYFFGGAGYAYCNWELTRLESLHYIERSRVSVSIGADPIFKKAKFLVGGREIFPHELVRMCGNTRDGVRGRGILSENAVLLATAYNYLVFEKTLAKSGGGKRGFLKSTNKLTAEAMEKLKSEFTRMYSNDDSGVIVLNSGLDFAQASNTAVELQLNETKENMRKDLCSIFCMSPGILNGTASESEFQNGIKSAVLPVLEVFEKALDRAVLLEDERHKRYFSFDSRSLMRGDIQKRYAAYTEAVRAGWLTKNEIRYEEDYRPISGMDIVSMSLGDVIFDTKTGQYYTPNRGETTEVSETIEVIKEGGEDDANRAEG